MVVHAQMEDVRLMVTVELCCILVASDKVSCFHWNSMSSKYFIALTHITLSNPIKLTDSPCWTLVYLLSVKGYLFGVRGKVF